MSNMSNTVYIYPGLFIPEREVSITDIEEIEEIWERDGRGGRRNLEFGIYSEKRKLKPTREGRIGGWDSDWRRAIGLNRGEEEEFPIPKT